FYFEFTSGLGDPGELIDRPGSFDGTINGGAGGKDTIVQQNAIFSGAATSASGTATINLHTFNYTGLEPAITIGGTIGGDD
ncbi:hypothetical protein Q4550_23910, partial [Anaerobacillus sp. 1_MG-2023]|nr:hypothetical protein [Anaerobacillus sp. 1_MG-2023]